MFSSRQPVRLRLALATAATALLGLMYWSDGSARRAVQAAPEKDPERIWSIGKSDGSGDEFAPGAAAGLSYEIGRSTPARDWRQRQEPGSVYRVRFALNRAPAAATLALDAFFLGMAPEGIELEVNGSRGRFRIRPSGAASLDERQANQITHSRQSLRMPLDAARLHAGANEIAISAAGEGGSLFYDSLALLDRGTGEELSAAVEPTIFFRRVGERLIERTEIVLRHLRPLEKVEVQLKLDGAPIRSAPPDDGYDFGERIVELDVPAPAGARPYELAVRSRGDTHRFHGEFRPEKRWRIFAGLKIHNDIGYTDLQPHVQELDNRNTDGALDIIAQNPFYKFNFETGWLIDNYIHSRKPGRVRRLMELAARDRVNLMSGLATGEELYRSLYFSKWLQRRYGVPLGFACLTDAPSHSWFLPTLLADAGIRGFANGSNQTRAPLLQNSRLNEESPFYWEGPDGRRVMTWFARSYLQLQRLVGDKPSVEGLRRTVSQFLARYRREDYPVDAVLLYGLDTDNADIRDGDAQILKQWNEAYAFPQIVPATDADYYAYLSEHFSSKLPVFRGDAGSYWEDGAGSTAAETAINRDTQRLLPAAEMAAALASLFEPQQLYPAGEFREAWKNLLFYDEHTWGANRSISQPERGLVTQQWEFKRAYAQRAHWAAEDLLYRSLNRLVQNISIEGPTLFVFNPDWWPRTDVVELELEPGRALFDLASGAPVPLEELRSRPGYRVLRFVARDVPGMGYRAYGVRRVEAQPGPAAGRADWQIESRYYRIALDPRSGAIAELYDKELGRDLVDRNAPYKLNELLYVAGGENSRILHDLLTLPAPQLEVRGQSGARLLDDTGRRIRIRASAPHIPEIETEITVYDEIKRVDIVNRMRKEEVRSKEAVYFAFPFAVSPPELAYQIQNAWVRPNSDQLPGACRDWFTTQNLVAARGGGAAIAWATPDAPLITLTDINRGEWRKSLAIRNGHVFSYVMNNYWFTNYKAGQGGDFRFRYFLTSGRNLDDAQLGRFDAETRAPLIGYGYYDTGNVHLHAVTRRLPLAEGAFFAMDAANAQVSAFKPAEDGRGYILRLRETAGRRGMAQLDSRVFPLSAADLANGVEDNRKALVVRNQHVEIPLEPHEFSTVRLVFGAPGGAAAR